MGTTSAGRHAWYSQSQAWVAGHVTYQRPDGTTYQVTTISSRPEHGCGWDDMRYLGVIGESDICIGSTEALNPKQAKLDKINDFVRYKEWEME